MSKNKELVAEAIAAIPLWIAFLDKKEAEQNALLEEMQGKKKETFMQKIASRFILDKADRRAHNQKEESLDSGVLPKKEESVDNRVHNQKEESVDSYSETLDSDPTGAALDREVKLEKKESLNSAARWAPKTTNTNQDTSITKEEEEKEEEEEEEEEENQFKDLF